MIAHIDERLSRWADWAAGGRRAAGLGYSPCTLSRWDSVRIGKMPDPGYDEEASETDRAVTQLPGELRRVVVVYYLKSGTVRQKARDCGIGHNTLYERLHHAHQRLDELLSRRESGITQQFPSHYQGQAQRCA